MSVRNALRKMFDNAKDSYDEYGQPIQKETMEDRLLRNHLEIERKRRVKKALEYYKKKHWREMTNHEMPYHKKFRALNAKKKKKRRLK